MFLLCKRSYLLLNNFYFIRMFLGKYHVKYHFIYFCFAVSFIFSTFAKNISLEKRSRDLYNSYLLLFYLSGCIKVEDMFYLSEQLQGVEYLFVCFIDSRCVQWSEINTCGLFRIMSHCFTDNGKRDIFTFGYGSPTVARYISSQWYG